jgi:hypothetical protein
MRRLLFSLGVALLVLTSATASPAQTIPRIFVTISDGVNPTVSGLALPAAPTAPPTYFKGGLILGQDSPKPASTVTTDVTNTLNILKCTTPPCTVHFPSGNVAPTAPLSNDTFTIQDVSATNRARVEKFDSVASADRVSFKGVKITSRVPGRVLTITYGVQSGALRDLTSTSTSYTGTAALSGTFKTATGLRATACNAGTTSANVADSCVKLSVALNGTTVNGAGATAVATVSVPCSNAFPTVNPCGTNGSYTAALGSFTGVNDVKSISCASVCRPTQVGTVTAEFNGTGEVLQLTASANGGMANIPDEAGGLEEVHLTLAEDLGSNRWIAYTAANERCQAVPKAPTINDTRNITNNSNLPISFEYHCGFFVPLQSGEGLALVSIVDPPAEKELAGSAATRNDAARVGFLPAPGGLQVRNISVFNLSYDVVEGTAPSGNNTLGDLEFADCTAGSLRVELDLRDDQGVPKGIARVYLGSEAPDNFRSGCNGFESIGTDLVNNPDARVDLSGLVGNLAAPCCNTFKKFQTGQTGQLRVRRISLIVDHGLDDPLPYQVPANHRIVFNDGNVNGVTARSSLQIVTGFARTVDLSTNGVSIAITKLTSPSVGPSFVPVVVKVIPSSQIVINGGKFTTSVNVNQLQPESGAQYTVSLCPNGAESDAGLGAPANTPLGLCIPDQAFMTLL